MSTSKIYTFAELKNNNIDYYQKATAGDLYNTEENGETKFLVVEASLLERFFAAIRSFFCCVDYGLVLTGHEVTKITLDEMKVIEKKASNIGSNTLAPESPEKPKEIKPPISQPPAPRAPSPVLLAPTVAPTAPIVTIPVVTTPVAPILPSTPSTEAPKRDFSSLIQLQDSDPFEFVLQIDKLPIDQLNDLWTQLKSAYKGNVNKYKQLYYDLNTQLKCPLRIITQLSELVATELVQQHQVVVSRDYFINQRQERECVVDFFPKKLVDIVVTTHSVPLTVKTTPYLSGMKNFKHNLRDRFGPSTGPYGQPRFSGIDVLIQLTNHLIKNPSPFLQNYLEEMYTAIAECRKDSTSLLFLSPGDLAQLLKINSPVVDPLRRSQE